MKNKKPSILWINKDYKIFFQKIHRIESCIYFDVITFFLLIYEIKKIIN